VEGSGEALFGEIEHGCVGELLDLEPDAPYDRVDVEGAFCGAMTNTHF